MERRSFAVNLSDAAVEALGKAGRAPEVAIDRWCWKCEREGEIIIKIEPKDDQASRIAEVIVEATCSHLADEIPSEESDLTLYLVWSKLGEEEGDESWALLTPYAAWLAGFRFMQDEAVRIQALYAAEIYSSGASVAIGIVVTDRGEPTGAFDELREAVRVAEIIPTMTSPAKWRKPNEKEMELLSWVSGSSRLALQSKP